MQRRRPTWRLTFWTAVFAVLGALLLVWPGLSPAQGVDDQVPRWSERSRALERAREAVVGVQVKALADARSLATLGQMRTGSGVVIGREGLVLTIGYLVLEAEEVSLQLDGGRHVPARVLGHDSASGLGLVQALAPLELDPAPLGAAALPAMKEALMVATGGPQGEVSAAWLTARRPFSGSWEYHLDQALLTAPAHRNHSGAGLFNAHGELVGIGSLWLADGRSGAPADDAEDAREPEGPANLFVPVDLLPPVLDELRRIGTTHSSQRAWLGLNCVELGGALHIVRVSQDSPADVAGLTVGDRILRIDGHEVHSLAALWQTLWAGGQPEREVVLDIQRDGEPQSVKVYSVERLKTLRRPQGI